MLRERTLEAMLQELLEKEQPFDDWHRGYHQCLTDLRQEAGSYANVKLMCRHCGLHVTETHGGYQHVRNQHARPSCGKLLNQKDVWELVA